MSKGLYRGKTEEKFLLTCGAKRRACRCFSRAAGGVMFSLEEVHKNFSASVLVSAMTSALTADFLCSTVTGTDTVFQFEILQVLPPEHYALIVGLGVILGVFGGRLQLFTLKVQSWYRSIGPAGQTGKLLIPFLCAGGSGIYRSGTSGYRPQSDRRTDEYPDDDGHDPVFAGRTVPFLGCQLWLRRARRHFLSPAGDRRADRRRLGPGGDPASWYGSGVYE